MLLYCCCYSICSSQLTLIHKSKYTGMQWSCLSYIFHLSHKITRSAVTEMCSKLQWFICLLFTGNTKNRLQINEFLKTTKYLLCGTLHIILVFVLQTRHYPNCTISQQHVWKIFEVLFNTLLVNVLTYKSHKNLNQINRQVTILDLRVLKQPIKLLS